MLFGLKIVPIGALIALDFMDTSEKSDGAVPSDSSTKLSLLSTRVDNLTQLVQDFISTVAVQLAVIDPIHPRQVAICLSPGSNSSGPLTIRHKPAAVALSCFNGQHVEAWLFQTESYFEFYSILPIHQLSLHRSIWMVRLSIGIVGCFAASNSLIGHSLLRSSVSDAGIHHCALRRVDFQSFYKCPLWQSFAPGSRLYLMKQYTCRMSFWLGVLFQAFGQIFKMKSLLESPHL